MARETKMSVETCVRDLKSSLLKGHYNVRIFCLLLKIGYMMYLEGTLVLNADESKRSKIQQV
jgi:hypothetical protein